MYEGCSDSVLRNLSTSAEFVLIKGYNKKATNVDKSMVLAQRDKSLSVPQLVHCACTPIWKSTTKYDSLHSVKNLTQYSIK